MMAGSVIAFAFALALSSCVSTPPPPFDQEPSPADELPPQVEANGRAQVEESTIRHQGSTDSAEVWIAQQRGGQGVCLIVVATDQSEEWVVGCSGGGGPGGVSLRGAGEFEYSAQGMPGNEPREGWIAVSDYVIARE
ncbi:MAG: hypothetical protein ACJLS2_14670 [Microcella pacifica]